MQYVATRNDASEYLLKGYIKIDTLQELYRKILEKDCNILLLKDFTDEFFTPSGLVDFSVNVQTVNSSAVVEIEDLDSADIMYKNVEFLQSINSIEELIYVSECKPQEVLSTLKLLCEFYNKSHDETLQANNKISTLHLKLMESDNKISDLNEKYDILMKTKNAIDAKFKTLLSRINFKYDKAINPNTIFQVESESRYDKILYIKEITRVTYVDTLLMYVREILKTLYNTPVRFVVIESPYAYGRHKLYPDTVPSYDMTYNDVCSSNIYMPGLQTKLMETILSNPSNVNYLIVLDRSGYDVPHLTGSKVRLLYTVSDVKDAEDMNVDNNSLISYSDFTLNIPFISGYSKLSTEERIRLYSSMPITKYLIDTLERR